MLRMIAKGGMATVHLGRVVGAGGFERLVAIKVMHEQLVNEPEFVAMFLDEARLAAQIHHPNVVATLDVQEDEEGVFLVMEYVEGPSFHGVLKALRKDNKLVPLPLALRIFLDALAGLHAAHELTSMDGKPLNLVHRDVSPQNILVGVDGVAKLTDFGVARAEARLASMTRDGAIKGKISYMAPEQAKSSGVDKRTDIYAAGLVFWEMLTGRRAFQGKLDVQMLTRILSGVESPPHVINPDVPPGISAVCMRALAVDPNQRYSSAAEFAEELEYAASAEGVAIATQRALSAFIKELGAHEGRTELLAAGVPSSRGPGSVRATQVPGPSVTVTSSPHTPVSSPSPHSSSGSGIKSPESGVRSDPLFKVDTAPRSDTAPVSTNAPLAAELAPRPDAMPLIELPAEDGRSPREKSRKPLYAALAVAVLGGAAVYLFIGSKESSSDSSQAGQAGTVAAESPSVIATAPTAAAAEPTSLPNSAQKPAESAAPPSTAAAPADTSASAAASAMSAPKGKNKTTATAKTPPTNTGSKQTGEEPGFRPKDL